MGKKEIHFEIIPATIDQYMSPIADLIREIDITQVPFEFISHMEVKYNNGSVVRVDGDDITDPIIILHSRPNNNKRFDTLFKNISNIKIYLDFRELEIDMDGYINDIFEKYMALDV
jgi:hypothetical protein